MPHRVKKGEGNNVLFLGARPSLGGAKGIKEGRTAPHKQSRRKKVLFHKGSEEITGKTREVVLKSGVAN